MYFLNLEVRGINTSSSHITRLLTTLFTMEALISSNVSDAFLHWFPSHTDTMTADRTAKDKTYVKNTDDTIIVV